MPKVISQTPKFILICEYCENHESDPIAPICIPLNATTISEAIIEAKSKFDAKHSVFTFDPTQKNPLGRARVLQIAHEFDYDEMVNRAVAYRDQRVKRQEKAELKRLTEKYGPNP